MKIRTYNVNENGLISSTPTSAELRLVNTFDFNRAVTTETKKLETAPADQVSGILVSGKSDAA